jgi:hypothetical protein
MGELRVAALDEVRGHKPCIPVTGQDDTPIRNEIELVRDL